MAITIRHMPIGSEKPSPNDTTRIATSWPSTRDPPQPHDGIDAQAAVDGVDEDAAVPAFAKQ